MFTAALILSVGMGGPARGSTDGADDGPHGTQCDLRPKLRLLASQYVEGNAIESQVRRSASPGLRQVYAFEGLSASAGPEVRWETFVEEFFQFPPAKALKAGGQFLRAGDRWIPWVEGTAEGARAFLDLAQRVQRSEHFSPQQKANFLTTLFHPPSSLSAMRDRIVHLHGSVAEDFVPWVKGLAADPHTETPLLNFLARVVGPDHKMLGPQDYLALLDSLSHHPQLGTDGTLALVSFWISPFRKQLVSTYGDRVASPPRFRGVLDHLLQRAVRENLVSIPHQGDFFGQLLLQYEMEPQFVDSLLKQLALLRKTSSQDRITQSLAFLAREQEHGRLPRAQKDLLPAVKALGARLLELDPEKKLRDAWENYDSLRTYSGAEVIFVDFASSRKTRR